LVIVRENGQRKRKKLPGKKAGDPRPVRADRGENQRKGLKLKKLQSKYFRGNPDQNGYTRGRCCSKKDQEAWSLTKHWDDKRGKTRWVLERVLGGRELEEISHPQGVYR